MIKKQLLFSVIGALAFTSCSGISSIYRESDFTKSDKSLVLDSKQRVVTNTSAKEWPVGRPPRYIKPERIICAEPSPDVASSLSKAITASLENLQADGSKQSAQAGYASAESLAQLGQRLATTQLLRDELADLCRSYANGAISTTNYTLRLAQLDEKMVTLLTAEMIAGAFQRDSILLGGAASVDGGQAVLDAEKENELSNNITTRQNELAQADSTLGAHIIQGAPAPTAITKEMTPEQIAAAKRNDDISLANYESKTVLLQSKRKSAEDAVNRARIAYNEARTGSGIVGVTADTVGLRGGDINSFGTTNSKASQFLVQLQENYLDRDELGAIVDTCLTRMNEDVLFEANASESNSTQNQADLERLRVERQLLDTQIRKIEVDSNFQQRKLKQELELEQLTEAQFEAQTLEIERDAINQIDDLVGKVNVLNERIKSKQDSALKKSDQILAFDRACGDIMASFSQQLMRAQDTRLELKLKQLEANVQLAALSAKRDTARMAYCVELAKSGEDAELEGGLSARSLCLSALQNPPSSGQFLGTLQSLGHAEQMPNAEDSDRSLAESFRGFGRPVE